MAPRFQGYQGAQLQCWIPHHINGLSYKLQYTQLNLLNALELGEQQKAINFKMLDKQHLHFQSQ